MGAFLAKRQFKRSNHREGVKIVSPQGVEYSTLEDLSAGGVKIHLDRDVPEGQLMELEFSIRSSNGLKVSDVKTLGKVVRSVRSSRGAGYHVGLQFLDLQDNIRHLINTLFIDDKDGPF